MYKLSECLGTEWYTIGGTYYSTSSFWCSYDTHDHQESQADVYEISFVLRIYTKMFCTTPCTAYYCCTYHSITSAAVSYIN